MKKAVLFYVKFPTPGKVKTRLAETLGARQAADLYANLAFDNFKLVLALKSHGIDSLVLFDPPEDEAAIRTWLPNAQKYLAQRGGDLGERLEHGFHEAFRWGYDQVAALGSDTLCLKQDHFIETFSCLDEHDLVFGPAEDGGYYLVAMKSLQSQIFHEIPWSTSRVLEVSIERARKDQLTYATLEVLNDLDEERDLQSIKGVQLK